MASERTTRPIDDAELLGWIENELPAEAHRRVSLALSRHPALRERVERMRADLVALRSLPDEPAPAGLLEGVADLLERELLVGFDADEASGDGGSLSVAGRVGGRDAGGERARGWLSPLIGERAGRRLGLAAAVLLMVGGLGYLGLVMVQQSRGPVPMTADDALGVTGNGIAMFDAGEGEPGAGDGVRGGGVDRGADAARGVDAARPRAVRLASGEVYGPPVPSDASLALASAGDADGSLAEGFEEIDAARALELARQGRLVIRVRTATPERTLAWLDRVARTSPGVTRDEALEARLASVIEPTPEALYPGRALSPLVLVDDGDGEAPGSRVDAELMGIGPLGPPRIAGIVVSELELSEASLERARRALSRDGRSAVFGDAGEPVRGLPMADASGLLWWMSGADQWRPVVRVPVVVETRR